MAVDKEVVENTDETQAEIAWAEGLMDDFKPQDAIAKSNGEVEDEDKGEDEVEDVSDADAETETEQKDEVEPGAITDTEYDTKKVAVKNGDGSVSYKTVRQLVDEGMLKADHTRKTQDLARERQNLEEDKSLLKLINNDKHARDYLLKRIDDMKSGKAVGKEDDIEVPEEVLEQLPWLKKLLHKVNQHDIEVSKYRTNTERAQTDQTVGKINTVMETAQAAIEKETGLKLESSAFRNRVGKIILESLDDMVPEDQRISVAGQMMLADKHYYLSKARESFQQEIELAKEKAITSAKEERTKKVSSATKPLKGGTASASAATEGGEFKLVKDKYGRPDMDVFLESAFKGGKR